MRGKETIIREKRSCWNLELIDIQWNPQVGILESSGCGDPMRSIRERGGLSSLLAVALDASQGTSRDRGDAVRGHWS